MISLMKDKISRKDLEDWFMKPRKQKWYLKDRSDSFDKDDKSQVSLQYWRDDIAFNSDGAWRVFTKTSKGLFVCTDSMTSCMPTRFGDDSFSFSETVTLDASLAEGIYRQMLGLNEHDPCGLLYAIAQPHSEALLKRSIMPEVKEGYKPEDFWGKGSGFYRGNPFFRSFGHSQTEWSIGQLVFASQRAGEWVDFKEEMIGPGDYERMERKIFIDGFVRDGLLEATDKGLYLTDKAKSILAVKYQLHKS